MDSPHKGPVMQIIDVLWSHGLHGLHGLCCPRKAVKLNHSLTHFSFMLTWTNFSTNSQVTGDVHLTSQTWEKSSITWNLINRWTWKKSSITWNIINRWMFVTLVEIGSHIMASSGDYVVWIILYFKYNILILWSSVICYIWILSLSVLWVRGLHICPWWSTQTQRFFVVIGLSQGILLFPHLIIT